MKHRKIFIVALSIILMIMIIIGTTYAYFSANIIGSEESETISLKGGTLTITVNGGSKIEADSIMPSYEPIAIKIITLTGNNPTDYMMNYTLKLIVDYNEFDWDSIKYTLESENTSENGNVIPSKLDYEYIWEGEDYPINIGVGGFAKGINKVHTYILKIYFLETGEDQSYEQGKSIGLHVKVGGDAVGEPNGWSNSQPGTLLKAIKDVNVLSTPKTVPYEEPTEKYFPNQYQEVEYGNSSYYFSYLSTEYSYGTGYTFNEETGEFTLTGISKGTYATSYNNMINKYIIGDIIWYAQDYTTGYYLAKITSAVANGNITHDVTGSRPKTESVEAILASTADDYGISYYFRGSVENNYVLFANMCWRIVRITGDGSIKLVLYNYNPNSVENPCDESQDGSSNAFARYSGGTYTSAFNETRTSNAYIGFMYGTPGSTSYALEHANINKSTILTNLETWYDAKLTPYENLLADTIWCNDKSTFEGLGYGANETHYGNWHEFPRLVCPNDNNGGKLSKFTVNDKVRGNGNLTKKIGLLTSAEIAFAGGSWKENYTYYLNKNATDDWWWTLSPRGFWDDAYVDIVNWDEYMGSLNIGSVHLTNGLRPAVSLVSTTTITGGEGTSGNPYIVQTT